MSSSVGMRSANSACTTSTRPRDCAACARPCARARARTRDTPPADHSQLPPWMPTVEHGAVLRVPSNGQFAAVAHARPSSSHCLRARAVARAARRSRRCRARRARWRRRGRRRAHERCRDRRRRTPRCSRTRRPRDTPSSCRTSRPAGRARSRCRRRRCRSRTRCRARHCSPSSRAPVGDARERRSRDRRASDRRGRTTSFAVARRRVGRSPTHEPAPKNVVSTHDAGRAVARARRHGAPSGGGRGVDAASSPSQLVGDLRADLREHRVAACRPSSSSNRMPPYGPARSGT